MAGSLLVAGLGTSGTAAVSPDADPAVVRDWNATMVATIVVDAGKANAEAFMWFGFVQAAVYNAVEGITRDYELYRWDKDGPQEASPEAAAAAAAHDVLLEYFPGSQARLDAQLASSLAGVTDGSAEQQGVEYGQAAAAHLIKQRLNDGRNAPITFDKAPAPGVWRPTPTAPADARPVAQSGQADDDDVVHAVPSGTTAGVDIRACTRRTSRKSKQLGAKFGSTRTAEQTETALFTTDVAIGGYQAALRDLTARHGMDISDTARLFAAVDMSITDAIDRRVGLEVPLRVLATDHRHPKRRYGREPGHGGGPDCGSRWCRTPPYPDYVSGFNGVTGALTGSLSEILGDDEIDLYITSADGRRHAAL